MLRAMRSFLGDNDMMAYLAMMAVRMLELHRVLKPTGSLYLHCDPTASHYLKILLDAVFGKASFQNEIIWSYRRWPTKAKRFQKMHDVIFFYSKEREPGIFNVLFQEASESSKKRWKGKKQNVTFGEDGGRNPTEETEEDSNVPMNTVWPLPIIAPVSKERLGYPTQKPVALLERILNASSNPGDVVLDPFCGCGTTVHAAQKLGREWIGIDVTHLAVGLIEKRLREAFPGIAFKTHGVPQDLEGAKNLAARGREDKGKFFEFEKWALSLINAQPGNLSKKGADKGIDGNLYFGAKHEGRGIVSVKAGENVGVAMIRDLRGVIEREGAGIGVFLTLAEPSKPMIAEAAGAGQYEMAGFAPVPRIQIVTVEKALELRDRAVHLPARGDGGFKRAAVEQDRGAQGALDL
jgi:site-specific DNA-methyltransferase (adenine-specific)